MTPELQEIVDAVVTAADTRRWASEDRTKARELLLEISGSLPYPTNVIDAVALLIDQWETAREIEADQSEKLSDAGKWQKRFEDQMAKLEAENERLQNELEDANECLQMVRDRIELLGDIRRWPYLLNAGQVRRRRPVADTIEHVPGLFEVDSPRGTNRRQ